VRWFENIGGEPPQFVMHIVSTAPDDVRFVRAADVDDDGFMDILSASFNDDSVRWHENLYAIPGDLTDDGEVDGGDLGILLGAWGPCAPGDPCPADLNTDDFVDGADLGQLLGNWGGPQ